MLEPGDDGRFRKSPHSGGGNCVEVRLDADRVAVRDSKDPGRVLHFTPAEWTAFVAGVKEGAFDLPAS